MRQQTFQGKCSCFGGPTDDGMALDEGLAFIEEVDLAEWWFHHLFLNPRPGNTGLGRSLDPAALYCAMRCNTQDGPDGTRQELRKAVAIVTNVHGVSMPCRLVDWGPNANTGRVIDLSPGMLNILGLTTDDEVSVTVVIP